MSIWNFNSEMYFCQTNNKKSKEKKFKVMSAFASCASQKGSTKQMIKIIQNLQNINFNLNQLKV